MIVYHQSEVLPSEGDTEQQPQQQQHTLGDTVAGSTATDGTAMSGSVPSVGLTATDAPQHTASSEISGGRRGRHKLNPSAAALRNASALMLASVTAVTRSLDPVEAMETGAQKVRQTVKSALIWMPQYGVLQYWYHYCNFNYTQQCHRVLIATKNKQTRVRTTPQTGTQPDCLECPRVAMFCKESQM